MTTMSTSTTDDLLRAARENAEFREAFRREILTDELLELPQRFAEYAASTDDRLDRIEALVASNSEAIASNAKAIEANSRAIEENSRVIAELVENTKAMNRRLDSMDEDIKSIKNDIKSLHGMYSQQHSDFHRFRGAYAENAARKDAGVIASKIAHESGNRVRRVERLTQSDMYDIFEEAIDRNLLHDIDDESQDKFAQADDAVLVTERGRARSQFYVVSEASHTAHKHDITRVTNHAKVIERVKGIPAYGVVAGVRIGQDVPMRLLLDAATFVKAKNPDAALWYLLEERDMDPMTEPR